jgi:serine/threonine protein kinase
MSTISSINIENLKNKEVDYNVSKEESSYKTDKAEESEAFIKLEDLKILKEIGKGAFGRVYAGEFKFSKVAIKEVELQNQNYDGLTFSEVNLMKKISYQYLVRYFGCCIQQEKMYIVMEYCDKSLYHLIHDPNIKLSVKQKLKILYQCAAGLYYLHSQEKPIIHRDIKSLNVLVKGQILNEHSEIEAKLSDYGSAKIIKQFSPITITGGAVGTVQWTAPEILRVDPYDLKCDIYSFSILIWEVFTSRVPYEELKLQDYQLSGKVGFEKIRPELKYLQEATPEEIKNLMIQCWNDNPSNRPDSKYLIESIKNILENLQ